MIFFIGKEAPRGGVRVCSDLRDTLEDAQATVPWESVDGADDPAFIYELACAPGGVLALRVRAVREDCAWKPAGAVGAVTLEPTGEVLP